MTLSKGAFNRASGSSSSSLSLQISVIDISDKLKYYLQPYSIKCFADAYLNPTTTTTITVSNQKCTSIKTLDLSAYENLNTLVIGSNSFTSVQTLLLNPQLRNLSVGDSSFTALTSFNFNGLARLTSLSVGKHSFKRFSLSLWDLSYLQVLSIGDDSFSSGGSFSVSNLPSLNRITIGSNCFQYSNLVLKDLAALQFVNIGANSFLNCEVATFESSFDWV